MARRSTAQLQLSDQRFVTRRIERALRAGDVRAAPAARFQSLLAGSLVTVLTLAGCAVLALVRPRPALDGAPILLGRPSGALYVRVDETLHPVLNLASARLIAATDADPRPVRESDIDRLKRGPLLGIPGAPQLLGAALPETATWSVCDTAGVAPGTTVIAADGQPGAGFRQLDPEQAVLVGSGSATYLLHRSGRTVDPALRPAGVTPRRVSGLLLNAIPETSPPAAAPALADPVDDASTLCVTWARLPGGATDITLSAGVGLPLPAGAVPVALAQADGEGPALDAVYLTPGRSGYLVAAPGGGARYLVADTGVRFTVGDDDAARSLGLPAAPMPVPWPVLAGLPAGPRLSRQDALVARDVVGTGRPS